MAALFITCGYNSCCKMQSIGWRKVCNKDSDMACCGDAQQAGHSAADTALDGEKAVRRRLWMKQHGSLSQTHDLARFRSSHV